MASSPDSLRGEPSMRQECSLLPTPYFFGHTARLSSLKSIRTERKPLFLSPPTPRNKSFVEMFLHWHVKRNTPVCAPTAVRLIHPDISSHRLSGHVYEYASYTNTTKVLETLWLFIQDRAKNGVSPRSIHLYSCPYPAFSSFGPVFYP